jgi:hypothetical protein
MGADAARSPGSFRALGERLLREAFRAKSTEDVEDYLDRAVVRVRYAVDSRPLPSLAAIRAGRFAAGALIEADLAGEVLSGAHLPGADLRWADLSGANLRPGRI